MQWVQRQMTWVQNPQQPLSGCMISSERFCSLYLSILRCKTRELEFHGGVKMKWFTPVRCTHVPACVRAS